MYFLKGLTKTFPADQKNTYLLLKVYLPTFLAITPIQSNPGDLSPLRHFIRVIRRHDLTKKSDSVLSESIFSKNVFLKVYFCKLYPAKVVRVCMSKAHANLLPNSQISHKLEYILNVTHLQQISISFVKSNPS